MMIAQSRLIMPLFTASIEFTQVEAGLSMFAGNVLDSNRRVGVDEKVTSTFSSEGALSMLATN